MEEEAIKHAAQSRLLTNGFEDGKENPICEDYTDDEIKQDAEAVDWDTAYQAVEQAQVNKK